MRLGTVDLVVVRGDEGWRWGLVRGLKPEGLQVGFAAIYHMILRFIRCQHGRTGVPRS